MIGICVAPEMVPNVWPHVKPFIDSALKYGDVTMQEIEGELSSGASLLWIVWDGTKPLAGVVTKLKPGRNGSACHIKACGGKQMSDWIGLVSLIEEYAFAEGCARVVAEGRIGWERVLKDYTKVRVVLEKPLRLMN